MNALDLDAVVRRSHDVLVREVDGELVLLALDAGEYYGLDHVGARIWELLGDGNRLRDVAADMTRTYDVDEGQARADLLELVAELMGRGLVRIVAPP